LLGIHKKAPELAARPVDLERPTFPPPYQTSDIDKHLGQDIPFRDDDTHVVSRYFLDGFRQPQVQEVALAPSRTWSPIPSVHRQSYGDEQDDADDAESDLNMSGSWIRQPKLLPQSAEVSQEGHILDNFSINAESSIRERRYIENPSSSLRHDRPSSYAQPDEKEEGRHKLLHQSEAATIENKFVDGTVELEPQIYHYIVPAGVNVIFQDEDGNEITRVGKNGTLESDNQGVRSAPIIVHDEFGKELYRTKGVEQSLRSPSPWSYSSTGKNQEGSNHHLKPLAQTTIIEPEEHHRPPWLSGSSGSINSSRSTKTIIIDEKGNQIPLKSRPIQQGPATRISLTPLGDISYYAQVDQM
ncbi:hypothetical protein CVT26_001562, partial [Gymnopilus dilepis]